MSVKDKGRKMMSSKAIKWKILGMLVLMQGIQLGAQNPNWTINPASFQNTMTAVMTVSDECMPSADPQDIIGAFDITGQIRGFAQTITDSKAFLTIRSNGSGEQIYFKVYDNGTNKVYNIYNYSIRYVADTSYGSPVPLVLNFDSNPVGASAGPDQEVFNVNTTTLAASGVGSWSVVEGAGGSFGNANSPTSSFTGVIGRAYILAWTLSDTGGCIGETDEVKITLVLSQPENNIGTCSDGLDNDGDGLYDCADPDCGKPVVSGTSTTDPTPIDCNTTQADGSLSIQQTGANLFSKDMGVNTQVSNTFNNLIAGNYTIWMKNSTTGCTATKAVVLNNTIDPLFNATDIQIAGPTVLCKGLMGVNYSVDLSTTLGMIEWSYLGSDVTIVPNGSESKVSFGAAATPGGLIAKISSACHSLSDTMNIAFASNFLCMFSNCPDSVNITTGLLGSVNSPQVYSAASTMTNNAMINHKNFQFSAGQSMEFLVGFEVMTGIEVLAEIKNCTPN